MDRMNFSAIEVELKTLCIEKPKTLVGSVDYANNTFTSTELEKVVKNFKESPHDTSPSRQNRFKYQTIYAVIRGRVFNREICHGYGVSFKMVEKTYNEYMHYREFLMSCSELNEFSIHLYKEAVVAYQVEKEKAKDFAEKATLFDQLFSPNFPRYWGEETRENSRRKYYTLGAENFKLSSGWKKQGLTFDECKEREDELTSEMRLLLSNIRQLTRKLEGKRPGGEPKNFSLIELFSETDLKTGNCLCPAIRLGTYSKIREVLKMYCSWFNQKNKADIAKGNKEKRKLRDAVRHNNKSKEAQLKRIQNLKIRQQKVYELQLKGKSLRQIAEIINCSYGTVQRTCAEIKALITEQSV